MNEQKLRHLWRAARQESPPPPPAALPDAVCRAIATASVEPELTLAAALSALFPRLTVAALSLIVLCGACDLYLTNFSPTEIGDGAFPLTDEWLFPGG